MIFFNFIELMTAMVENEERLCRKYLHCNSMDTISRGRSVQGMDGKMVV